MPKSDCLINTSAIRALILATVAETRHGWPCTRVSQEAIDAINADLKRIIEKRVHQHPSIGKTFTAG